MRVYEKAQIKTPLFNIGLISMLLTISPFDFLKILKVAFSKFEFGCPYPPSQGQCFTEVAGPEPILHPVSDRRFFFNEIWNSLSIDSSIEVLDKY